MKPFIVISFCALLPLTAPAQLFTFGVQGGIPAQTPLGQTNNKMPFVLGPTAEIRLVSGLSLATGVLFSRSGQRFDNAAILYPENSVTLYFSTAESHAVEVPILAKYRFFGERRAWQPFVSGGITVRRTSIETTSQASTISTGPLNTFVPPQSRDTKTVSWNPDPTVGAGVDFRAGRFHLEPEVRYSYWGAGKNTIVRKNQVQFLLGFRF